jgi:type IV pilus assembly protein PilA
MRARISEMRVQRQSAQAEASAGFSLIELLIVVAIILIIAAIAIPSILRAREAANEAASAQNVRTITTASMSYYSTYGNGYPPTLATLGPSAAATVTCDQADLIDSVIALAPSTKSGYLYTYTGDIGPVTAPAGCSAPGFQGYLVTATPTNIGITGQRSFCSDEPAVIHFDPTGNAIASSAACDALPTL